ncbi:putative acetyltransferase [archaeon BMS3Abin17]|nr:putative acetyltransferase [archaeon BMS3Abin17]HDZ61042.1 N-acetyltransferase [Candidatus Pacearchaeota archaeon]
MPIRPAEIKDLKGCEEILKIPELRFIDGYYPDINYRKEFIDKDYFLVFEMDNKIVGCVLGEPLKCKHVIIWFFAVKKEYRRQGIGEKLIKEFEKRCCKNKHKWCILHTPISIKNSMNFYKKLGYNKGESFVEFEKEL